MSQWSLVFSLVAIILSSITAIFSILAFCKVVGLEKSTHKIEWMDPSQNTGPTGKDLAERFSKHMYPDIEREQL